MGIFNRKNILKYNLLAAIALSLIAISTASADLEGTPQLGGYVIAQSASAFKPATVRATTETRLIAQSTTSPTTTSISNLAASENKITPSSSLSQPTSMSTISTTKPADKEKSTLMSEQGNRKNLSSDITLTQTGNSKKQSFNNKTRTDYAKKDTTELLSSGSFIAPAKRNAASGMSFVKRANTSAVNTASLIIGTAKPMTTKNIRIHGKLRGKMNNLSQGYIKGIIPIGQMLTDNEFEPVLLAFYLLDQKSIPATSAHINDPDQAVTPPRNKEAGNGNSNVQPFSDTVSRHIIDQPKPINLNNIVNAKKSAVNYAKTGLSPPATPKNNFTASFLAQDVISTPLSLNRIDGNNNKGLFIYNNLQNKLSSDTVSIQGSTRGLYPLTPFSATALTLINICVV